MGDSVTEIKRIRDFTQEMSISVNQKILIDDDSYRADEEFRHVTIQQLVQFFLSQIEFGELEIYIVKPVKSIATTLPVENMVLGDRYFITSGDLMLSIAEWNGASWNITKTKPGDCIYSYSQKKFIVRTDEGFEISDGRDSYETDFNVTESVRVNHNLNRYPSVVVMDSSNRQIITQVTYLDRNTCEVSWTGETSGKIVCN